MEDSKTRDRSHGVRPVGQPPRHRLDEVRPKMLQIMKEASDGWLVGVKRRVNVRRPEVWFHWTPNLAQRPLYLTRKDCEVSFNVLRKVKECFKAKVWLDDRLLYRDGSVVDWPFKRIGRNEYETDV